MTIPQLKAFHEVVYIKPATKEVPHGKPKQTQQIGILWGPEASIMLLLNKAINTRAETRGAPRAMGLPCRMRLGCGTPAFQGDRHTC